MAAADPAVAPDADPQDTAPEEDDVRVAIEEGVILYPVARNPHMLIPSTVFRNASSRAAARGFAWSFLTTCPSYNGFEYFKCNTCDYVARGGHTRGAEHLERPCPKLSADELERLLELKEVSASATLRPANR